VDGRIVHNVARRSCLITSSQLLYRIKLLDHLANRLDAVPNRSQTPYPKRFVEEGAHVVITGRREKELKEAAALIGKNVITVAGDVTRIVDLGRLYAVVKEEHGHIDVLFVNAGWGEVAPIQAATEAHVDKAFDLNAKVQFFTVQKALPHFKDGGSIILNSSVANVMGLPAFIHRVRLRDQNAQIIALANYEGDEALARALQSGAQSYLLFGLSGEELVAAIRKAQRYSLHLAR